MFHLLNRAPFHMAALRQILVRLGYRIELVSYAAWLDRIEAAPDSGLFAFLGLLRAVALLLPRYTGFRVNNTVARAVLGRAAPEWYACLPSPEAICRRIVGDLIAAGCIPPPAWRCRGIFQGTAIAERVMQEWQANDAGVAGLPPIAIPAVRTRPGGGQVVSHGMAAGRDIVCDSQPGRRCARKREPARGRISGDWPFGRCAASPIASARRRPPCWRRRSSLPFGAFATRRNCQPRTLQIAMLSDASPLLGLNRSGLMQHKIDLSANRSFATLCPGCLRHRPGPRRKMAQSMPA